MNCVYRAEILFTRATNSSPKHMGLVTEAMIRERCEKKKRGRGGGGGGGGREREREGERERLKRGERDVREGREDKITGKD